MKPNVTAGQDFEKKNFFSGLKSPYDKLPNEKKTYFVTRKIIQNFEDHDHWHCGHLTFWFFKF